MPFVNIVDQNHAQKEEDDGVTGRAEHFDKVLHSRIGFVRNISEGVMGLNQSTTDGTEKSISMIQMSNQ